MKSKWIVPRADRDRDLHADHLRLDAVVIEVVLVRIRAGRQLRKRSARTRLGVREQRFDRGLHHAGTEALEQFFDTPHADQVRGDLRFHVAVAMAGRARVEQDDIEDVLPQLARGHQLDRRKAKAFLKNARAVGALAAGDLAADVGMVGRVRHEPGEPVAGEHRRGHRQVGKMRAAADVGVVGQEHVPARNAFQGKAPHDVLHHAHQRAQMDRRFGTERNEVAVDREARGRAVAALLDVGRERRAKQRREHLVGRGLKTFADHFDRDRVDLAFAILEHVQLPSFPVVFSSSDQAVGPNSPFHF